MRRQTLFRHAVDGCLWLAGAALLLAAVYAAHEVRAVSRRRQAEGLEAQAHLLATQVQPRLNPQDTAAIDRLCRDEAQATGTRFTVLLASGKLAGDSAVNRHEEGQRRPEFAAALAGRVGDAVFSEGADQDYLAVAVPILEGSRVLGVVRAADPLADPGSAMLGNLLAVAAGALVLLTLVLRVRSRHVTEPLDEIRAAVERFASGELDKAVPRLEIVELDAIGAALNDMAARLGDRIDRITGQETQHEAMLSSMREGVIAFDLQGRVLSLNETCARMLGVESGRLRGRLLHEVIRKPDLLRLVDAALAQTEVSERDLPIQMNEDRWLHATTTGLHDRYRRKIGALVVLHDVTRLRQLETVRRDFVANVSHELRTPITSIKGFLETLLDGAMEDKENAIRFMRIVLRQVNRLNAIIEDLMALSRIERGSEEQSIPLRASRIRPMLEAAIELCGPKAADKHLALELDCDEALLGRINSRLLEQAVINLIDNAVKYSNPGGRIHVSAAEGGQGLCIAVRDEGCGIEARYLPRLFERFYRVDKARSRELGGTGLGLAIVKHITLAHQGTVEVESRVGQGSCFSIRLPALPPDSEDRAMAETPAESPDDSLAPAGVPDAEAAPIANSGHVL